MRPFGLTSVCAKIAKYNEIEGVTKRKESRLTYACTVEPNVIFSAQLTKE
jgi:hypothetical protein